MIDFKRFGDTDTFYIMRVITRDHKGKFIKKVLTPIGYICRFHTNEAYTFQLYNLPIGLQNLTTNELGKIYNFMKQL